MVALARKFAFDTVFDDVGAVAWTPPPTRHTLSSDDLETVRTEAFAAGEAAAGAQAQRAQAFALQQLADATGQALALLAQAAHEHRRGAAELALAAARRIADAALERFPEAPVAAALTALAREIDGAPRLTVRVTVIDETLRTAVEQAAANAGFAGKLELTADPSAPPAAFSFDWGDGRATYDPQACAERVTEALREALAAEGLHAEPLAGDTPLPEDSE